MRTDPDEHDSEYGYDEYDPDDDQPIATIRRSRAVRWTAILVVASFALAGLSSLSHWW